MKLLELKKETDFRHLNLFSLAYTDRNRKEKSWVFASRSPEPMVMTRQCSVADAAVVVPYHREKKRLVIIREFRVPLGMYQIGFPAGLLDRGESAEQAAVRELREETGLEVARIIRTSPPVFTSSGMSDESVSMVYVECTGEPSLDLNEASEDIEVILVDPAQARKLVETPDICFDVKSWIIISQFADRGSL